MQNSKPNANEHEREAEYMREFAEWEKTLQRINAEFFERAKQDDAKKFNRDEEIE